VLAELLRRIEGGFSIGPLAIPSAVGISELVFGMALILTLRWRPAGVLGAEELEIDPRPSRTNRGIS
jgi:ABC-type branched-subunit amino acid transport system permease subunit